MTCDAKETRGIVVVTGVSSGIGAAIARRLVQADYIVFGSVRRAHDATGLVEACGARFQPIVLDIRDKEAVTKAAQTVQSLAAGRPLAGLVNNAGLATFGPMECLEDENFEASIFVNLIGTRLVTNAFLPLLRDPDGREPGKIINISSLSGVLNTPMNGAYCVAKHALESLGEIYRRELLPEGIDVVSLRSGPVQSEIWNKSKSQATHYNVETYQKMAINAGKIMAAAERDAIPADDIARAVQSVLARPRNRTAYHFSRGALTARILAALPDRWSDRLILRALMKPSDA